jgi:ketosteroid isomerase-like protein
MEEMLMRNRLVTLVACGALVTAASGMVLFAQSGSARAAVEAGNAKFVAGLKAGKAAEMAALYTEDAIAFPPNSEAVRGRAAIQKLWQGFIDSGAREMALTTMGDVEESGDLALEEGTAIVKDAAGKEIDKAKYLVVWKKVGGKWMLYRDIWNSSMPAPAAEKKPAS